MSIEYIDGFDEYETADIARYWNVPGGAIQSGGRSGNLLYASTGTYKTFGQEQQRWVGFWMNTVALSPPGSRAFLTFFDGFGGGTHQVFFRTEANGTISICLGDGTVIDTSDPATEALSAGVPVYIEAYVKVASAPNGAYQLWVNNQKWLDGTGNTQSSGNAYSDMIGLLTQYFDDLYILNTDGAAPWNTRIGANTELGDTTPLGYPRVETLMPNGDGKYSQFDTVYPASPTTHYDKVDEETTDFPDLDATYVESPTTGDIDTYDIEDLTSDEVQVLAVQTNICAKQTDAGNKGLHNFLVHETVDYEHATDITLSAGGDSAYKYYKTVYEQAPDSAAWTATDVNNLQIGYKVIEVS